LPVWLVSVGVTAAFTVVVSRRQLRAPALATPFPGAVAYVSSSTTFAVGLAGVLLVFLPAPALPVLALGMALVAVAIRRGTVSAAAVRDAIDPLTLVGVFGLAVALGALARGWSGPAHLVATAGLAETALLGAVASVALNNLPAAVLLASRPPAHAMALLLGLNVGPNLAVTGSLSALIWFRAATSVGAAPSAARVSRLGVVLVPLTIAAALAVLQLFPVR